MVHYMVPICYKICYWAIINYDKSAQKCLLISVIWLHCKYENSLLVSFTFSTLTTESYMTTKLPASLTIRLPILKIYVICKWMFSLFNIDYQLYRFFFVRSFNIGCLSVRMYNSSLNDNKIRCITSGAFDKLRSLLQVNLQNNPFNCNCHLRWMSSWIRKKSNNNKILIGKFISNVFSNLIFIHCNNHRQYPMLFASKRC